MKLITLLTGPAASGKNTIGHIYATQFCQRCAVIDGDVVRAMLRQPHAAPWEAEGLAQHRLGVKHVCMLARSFVDEGYEGVILDVLWADLGQLYRQQLRGYPLRIIRLMPSWKESLRRLHERPHTITDDEAHWVYQQQESITDFDHSIDNSFKTAKEVAAWLAALA